MSHGLQLETRRRGAKGEQCDPQKTEGFSLSGGARNGDFTWKVHRSRRWQTHVLRTILTNLDFRVLSY